MQKAFFFVQPQLVYCILYIHWFSYLIFYTKNANKTKRKRTTTKKNNNQQQCWTLQSAWDYGINYRLFWFYSLIFSRSLAFFYSLLQFLCLDAMQLFHFINGRKLKSFQHKSAKQVKRGIVHIELVLSMEKKYQNRNSNYCKHIIYFLKIA